MGTSWAEAVFGYAVCQLSHLSESPPPPTSANAVSPCLTQPEESFGMLGRGGKRGAEDRFYNSLIMGCGF